MVRHRSIGSGAPNITPEVAGGTPASPRLEGTDYLFYCYLLLLATEFLGLPALVPILKVTRFSTLLAWSLTAVILLKVGGQVFTSRQGKLLAIFVGWTGLSLVYAVVTTYAFDAFRTHSDYFGLFAVTLYLVDRPVRIRRFAFLASTLILILTLTNVGKLTSGVRAGSFRAGVFLGDGNDFAWCLNVLLPFAMFLLTRRSGAISRLVGGAAALAAVTGIIGTMSRGGTLALVASFVYYWAFIMKRKSAGVGLLATGLGVVLLLAPPAYFDRLGTIQNYEADNSAMSRLQVWRAGMKMAVDYPLGVGGGNFSSAYGRYYIPDAEQNVMTYKKRKWMSAHSVYFKLLGEYGIIGVLWLLTLLVTNVRDNAASRERLTLQSLPDAPAAEWPLFINMSLVGYAVSGVFLGGLTYPYLYLLSGLTASAVGQSVWTTVPRGAGVERESVASGSNGTSLQTTARDREALRRQSVTDRARIAMSSRRRAS